MGNQFRKQHRDAVDCGEGKPWAAAGHADERFGDRGRSPAGLHGSADANRRGDDQQNMPIDAALCLRRRTTARRHH